MIIHTKLLKYTSNPVSISQKKRVLSSGTEWKVIILWSYHQGGRYNLDPTYIGQLGGYSNLLIATIIATSESISRLLFTFLIDPQSEKSKQFQTWVEIVDPVELNHKILEYNMWEFNSIHGKTFSSGPLVDMVGI